MNISFIFRYSFKKTAVFICRNLSEQLQGVMAPALSDMLFGQDKKIAG